MVCSDFLLYDGSQGAQAVRKRIQFIIGQMYQPALPLFLTLLAAPFPYLPAILAENSRSSRVDPFHARYG